MTANLKTSITRRPILRSLGTLAVACLVLVSGSSVAGASSYSITPGGAAVTVKTTAADEVATATFAGTAGMRISLKMTGVTIGISPCCSAKVTIKKPNGSALAGPVSVGRNGGYIDLKTLPVAGTYKIVVDPNGSSTGSMTLTLYKVPADSSVAVTPGGAPVTVTTTTPGQNGKATFTGAVGQRVSMRVTGASFGTSSCCTAQVSLLAPDGTAVGSAFSVGTASAFADARTLPQAGTYTVKIDPVKAGVGSASLTVYAVPADAGGALSFGSPSSVTTTVPGQNMAPTFAGVAGHRVAVQLSSVSLGTPSSLEAKVSILKPDGTQLAAPVSVGSSGTFVEPKSLPVTGTYAVLVDPAKDRTGSVSVTAYDTPADASASITPGGSPVTLSTTSPGQNAVATFTGTAGKRVSLDLSSVSFGSSTCCGAKVSIAAPGGGVLAAPVSFGTNGGFVDATVLPATGTYSILVDPQGTVSGSVTLTLYDVPANPTAALTAGSPSTLTTTVPGQNAQYTFTGTVGQRVALRLSGISMASSSCCGLKATVLKPDGTALFTPGLSLGTNGAFMEPKTLPVAGTYKVVLDPAGKVTGSATATFYSVPADVAGSITAGGAGVAVSLSTGQNAALSFSATANQRVSLKVTNATFGSSECCGAAIRILKPDGTALTSVKQFGTAGTFVDPVTIPAAGTYKVFVDPLQENAGGATVNLYTVPADTSAAISVGGSATVTLATPGQRGKLTFTGSAGQSVTVTASSVTFGPSSCCSTYLTILGPSGTPVPGVLVFGTAGGSSSWTLPSAGTYTILVDPQAESTGSASIGLASP